MLDILAAVHEVALVSFFARDDSEALLSSWKTYERFIQVPMTISRLSDEKLSPEGKRLKAMAPISRFGMPEFLGSFDLPAMWNCIAKLNIQQFDAVHVRYAYMAVYALALKRVAPHLRLIIDLDDIPSVIAFRKVTFPTKPSNARIFLWEIKELLRTYAFERGALRTFDSVWVCSKHDRHKIARQLGADRALIVENVVDTMKLASIERRTVESALLFVGDFNYLPNRQGAEFFIEEVWPAIRSAVPDAQLWLVGSNRQAKILEWNGREGVVVTGFVADVSPYLSRAMMSIAPILVGAGTRLKILEAMGVGLPVVTTSVGAEGIEATNGVDLIVADSARDFANECVRLLRDPASRDRLAESGKSLVKNKYDISIMSRTVLTCYADLAVDSLEHGYADEH